MACFSVSHGQFLLPSFTQVLQVSPNARSWKREVLSRWLEAMREATKSVAKEPSDCQLRAGQKGVKLLGVSCLRVSFFGGFKGTATILGVPPKKTSKYVYSFSLAQSEST